MDIKQLRDERAELITQIRTLADREADWTEEDKGQWVEVNERFDSISEEIDEGERKLEVATRVAQLNEIDQQQQFGRDTTLGEMRYHKRHQPTIQDQSLALQAWFWEGRGRELTEGQKVACRMVGVKPSQRELPVQCLSINAHQGYQMWSTQRGPDTREMNRIFDEYRALNITTPTQGPETVPEGFSYELERFLLAYGGVRRVARVFQTSGEGNLRWPTVDDTGNLATIVGESTDITGTEADPVFGEIVLGAHKYVSMVKISAELIDDSAFNMVSLLAEFLGVRVGRGQAVHFATGTGTGQPEGIVTGSSKGADAAASAITGDDLISLQGSLDPAYEMLPSIGWMMNKNTLTAVRKLKGVDNDYIWQPGLRASEPDLLLGKPYTIVQELADVGTSTKPVLYGAFEKYLIRDVSAMRFYRLQELYREVDQDGFVIFRRSDGRVLNSAAIKHILNAAS